MINIGNIDTHVNCTPLKQVFGHDVQEDFELICFDLVSSPSTPGAYLFLNKDDKNRYEENLEEEIKSKEENNGSINKTLDLMKKLTHFLDK